MCLLLFCALLLLQSGGEAPRTLSILPLGDSITEGVPGVEGYRAFLRDELARRKIALRFIGTRRSPAGAHEGWSGITADDLLSRIDPALAGPKPDLVLLHIGTNDIGLGQEGAAVAPEIAALLQRIALRAP